MFSSDKPHLGSVAVSKSTFHFSQTPPPQPYLFNWNLREKKGFFFSSIVFLSIVIEQSVSTIGYLYDKS